MRARRPSEAAGIGKGLDAHGVMRQNTNHKRPRNRGNLGRKPSNNRNQTFDSNGPSVRIRGNAVQVHEKYLTLARDAYSSGDRVMAENYFQHAEHYYRIVNATTDPTGNGQRSTGQQPNNGYQGGNGPVDDDFDNEDEIGRPMYAQSNNQGGRAQDSGESQQRDDRGDGESDDNSERQADRSGERRRRSRRNGQDGGRSSADEAGSDTRRSDESRQDDRARQDDRPRRQERPSAEPAPEVVVASAPAEANTPAKTNAADGSSGETAPAPAEKPRRRTRRRPVAVEADSEPTGRDSDEEPVLI